MTKRIQQYLASHKISAHLIFVVITSAIALYHDVPEVHDYAWTLWTHIPPSYKQLATTIVAAVMWYWRTQKVRAVWTDAQRQVALDAPADQAQGQAVGK